MNIVNFKTSVHSFPNSKWIVSGVIVNNSSYVSISGKNFPVSTPVSVHATRSSTEGLFPLITFTNITSLISLSKL